MYHHIEKITRNTKQRNTINHLQKWSTVTQYNSLFSHNLTFSKFVLNKESTPRNTFSHRNTFSSNLCTSDNFHTKRGISCESNFHVTGLCILCRDAVTRTFASRNHDSTRWCFSLSATHSSLGTHTPFLVSHVSSRVCTRMGNTARATGSGATEMK